MKIGLFALAALGGALAQKTASGRFEVINDGIPAGKFVNNSGIDTYISSPSTPTTKAVLHLTDIFGVPLKENQLLADSVARAGYLVVMPDLFRGEAIPPDALERGLNLTDWLTRHNTSDIDSIVTSTISYMKNDLEVTKIGGTGYCFGGKYVPRFLSAGKGIDVGFIAHPSNLQDSEIQGVAGPLTVAAGELDTSFNATNRHNAETILQDKNATWELTTYSGAVHGFAVRGDYNIPEQKYAKEAAFSQAVRWFDFWL